MLPGETRNVVFDLGKVDADSLSGAFNVHLTSDMVLPNQQLNLATVTPWTQEGASTALSWSVGCTVDGQEVPLGETYEDNAAGCPCVCDVDGVMRHCGGEPCF